MGDLDPVAGKVVRVFKQLLHAGVFNVSRKEQFFIAAGLSLGANGIAAVALGVPGYGVLVAIIYSLTV